MIHAAVVEALKCKESGESKVIAFNLCGHGHFDMFAYQAYMAGELKDFELSDKELQENLAALPGV